MEEGIKYCLYKDNNDINELLFKHEDNILATAFFL